MPEAFSDRAKKEFDVNGFCVVDEFITEKDSQELRELIVDMAEFEKNNGGGYFYPFDKDGLTQRVWNLTNKSSRFRELLVIDELSEIMNYIFRRPTSHQLFHLSSFQANILYPGADRQKLHVDTPFPEPLPPWPAKANSIWLLDDFTDDNGATEVVPESQTKSVKPTKEDDKNIEYTKVVARRGSVLFTHGNLWHRAGANRSMKPRIGLLCSFAASYMKEIASEEDQSVIILPEVKSNASKRLSAILGIGHGIKDGALVNHEEKNQPTSLGCNTRI